MAKISALNGGTGIAVLADGDLIPITDVSDTTEAASGTTKPTEASVVKTYCSLSPTLVTPVLGVATATSINGLTLTTSTGTLSITNGKTATVSNTLTLTATDGSTAAFGAGGTVAYTSNKLSAFAATTSSELAGVLSDETGSGALVFGTAPTISAPTMSGIRTTDGAEVTSGSAMGALSIDVTKNNNTKSVSADSIFTFSGSPATSNTWFGMRLYNTDISPHLITIPSSFSMAQQAAITTFTIPASGKVWLVWMYDGTTYHVFGEVTLANNLAGTTAPTINDDTGDGYRVGSLWLDTTNDLAYICLDASAAAAVWRRLGSTGKHMIPIMASGMIPSATGGCAALATIASAANQPDITTLDFDTTTQEYAQFAVPMPESWDEGTLTFMPIWSHAATVTNFGTVWSLAAVAVSNDDPIAVAFGSVQTSTDTGGTTNDVYIGPESSAITVAGTPQAGDVVFFRVSRVTGDANDTLAVDARLHGIRLYYTTNAEIDA